MTKKVSVIIPVYKTEAFLNKCVDSVINQTYKNLEIILVDDGSPDACPAICDAYGEKDGRVRVLHKNNGGLSDARNAGLDICTGDYITFIDSDDYVSADFIEALVYGAEEFDADLCVVDFKEVKEDEQPQAGVSQELDVKVYSGKEALKRFCKCGGESDTYPFYIMACVKLYKRSLFDGLRFPAGKLHEDEFLVPQIYYYAEKCAHVAGARYFYLKRKDSITTKKSRKNYSDVLLMYAERIRFFEERGENELLNATIDRFVGQCLVFYTYLYKDKQMSAELDGYIKKYFIRQNYKIFRKTVLRAGKIYKFSRLLFRILFKIKRG